MSPWQPVALRTQRLDLRRQVKEALGDIDKSKQAVVEGYMNEIPVSLTHGEWRNTGLVLYNGRIEARRDRLHVMLVTKDGVFENGWLPS